MKFVKLIKILKKEKIQIILFIKRRNALTLGVAAAVIARVPVMINWHNETNKIYRYNWLFGKVRRCLYHFVDTIVAVAKIHKDYIHNNENVSNRKI